MVTEKTLHNATFNQKLLCMYSVQPFIPISSYPGLPFYITVDNCNYQLIIRGIKSPHEFIYTVQDFLITALQSGTWYSTNMVEALQYLG